MLFQLLKFFWVCTSDASYADNVKADKDAAEALIIETVLPLMQKLLRSFDPATVDAATGNNALHEICRLFYVDSVNVWSFKLTELLIADGVSMRERNKKGCTPLLQWAASMGENDRTADGLRLMLEHGSDLHAQDGDGNGVLHHLVSNGASAVLIDLLDGDGVGHLDCHLVNSAGQTAADLAAVKLAQLVDSNANSPAKRIHRLMMAQTALWTKHTQPALLRCLDAVLPVTDVAKLALGYIDGSGLPFSISAEAESDEKAEPAAAAAAAQS